MNQTEVAELTVLWTQTQNRVADFISLLVPDFHDAQDVLQRVAIALVRHFDRYDKSKSFYNWAIGIAKYEILLYRRERSRDRHVFDEGLMDQILQAYQENEPYLQEARKALNICLQGLKGKHRQLVDKWYLQGVSHDQIANELKTSPNVIYVTLHRIRVSLRECVRRRLDVGWEAL